MKTVDITLRIKYDDESNASPEHWLWEDLLGMNLETNTDQEPESVVVLACKEV